MSSVNLRELTILSFKNDQLIKEEEVKNFKSFIEVYCSDLKKTEWDVLLNDELYVEVLSLFNNLKSFNQNLKIENHLNLN